MAEPHTHRWAITHVTRNPDSSRTLHFVCTAGGCGATFQEAADSYLGALATRRVADKRLVITSRPPNTDPAV